MKTTTTIGLIILLTLLFAACDDHRRDGIVDYDLEAPLPPVGIRTISLDNAVEMYWYENQEPDIAGYKIYVSDSYDGRYDLIGSSRAATFVDRGARNGYTYYYAVTAYDFSGNESRLSRDVAYDTPRPEGYHVQLIDRFANPLKAGYDFSDYSILHYDTDFTDLYAEFTQSGIPYFVVWEDTDIQDMGYTTDLDEISVAPQKGWSPTRDAHAIIGHTYVVRTWDNHYAKVRVTDILPGGIQFDWAYQTARGNPELIAPRPPQTRSRGSVRNRDGTLDH